MSIERLIVAKYGGTSLANAERFIMVGNITDQDRSRRVIVPSAPGKDEDNCIKITDLLIDCGESSFMNRSYADTFGTIERRFLQIAEGLGVYINDDLEEVKSGLRIKRENQELSVAWAASRGEWLSGKILSRFLGAEFVDAAEIMKFQNDGTFDQETSHPLIAQRLNGLGRFVVPGFYGQDEAGRIRTFSRGGSDITGANLAAALRADIYENWTDTNGVHTADPKIVPEARTILFLLYEEMQELGFLGAKVLHPLAVDPAWDRNIPIHVRNTFNPRHPGTWIAFANFPLEKKAPTA
ncbi:hypothetical protein HYU96_02980 [Candidatus Daviesbacteria bacterium]|nr:hypothetical protein [Candidatus Daviesbacteria bacterium]